VTEQRIDEEFASTARAAWAYGLLVLVLLATVGLPIATFWRGEPLRVETIGPLDLFQGQAVLAGFLLLWFALQQRADLRTFLQLPVGRWTARVREGLRVGVSGWLITMGAMIVLGAAAQAMGVAPHAGFTELMVWMAKRTMLLRIALIATAMVVEEAFFRAFLQPRFGLVPATLCFALSHVNYGSPTMSAGVFVIGWILGRAFEREGDLAICAVAHGTFDAIQLLIVLPLIASHL
jgi:membrane protease YdiL (CAAX protease family)